MNIVSAKDMDGQCPVQWYGYRDGWLLYFRARDGWSLRAWAPGEHANSGDPREDTQDFDWDNWCAHEVIDDGVLVETGAQIEEPTWPEGENSYPGWWSHSYAAAVCNAAISAFLASRTKEGSP